MTKRYIFFALAIAFAPVALAASAEAAPSLEQAVRAADAKYIEAPETGVTDNAPKIVAGGGEEGLPPLDEELVLGPLKVTLTYAEETSADEMPPGLEDIPEEAMLPGEAEIGPAVSRIPVVTVSFTTVSFTADRAGAGEPGTGDQAADEDGASATGEPGKEEAGAPQEATRVVATLKGPDSGMSNPPVSIQIADLDPSNPHPEVVVSFFTGGAHCCSVTHVVAGNADGSEWSVVDVGEFDGGPMLAVDLDGDGTYEFETRDNAFLYAFACYACSQAPLKILALEDGKIVDVSTALRFQPAHAAWLKNMIVGVADQDVNGFLAGYVGQKVRLGEGRNAWDTMLKFHDKTTDWGLEICSVERDEAGDCPGETTNVTFPEALERMLKKNGYKIEG